VSGSGAQEEQIALVLKGHERLKGEFGQLEPVLLRERYEKESRPIVIGPSSCHDKTLEFWVEAYFAKSQG
jgi:hypothetical protein